MLHGVNQPNFESMNEQLRLQMLSGIITEGEYKAKLQENQEASLEDLKALASSFSNFEDMGDSFSFQYDTNDSKTGEKISTRTVTISPSSEDKVKIKIFTKSVNPDEYEKAGAFTTDTYEQPITGLGGAKMWLNSLNKRSESKSELDEKDSLNESMIGGIVGVGAIAQIPPRAKADYEMAFEHFLGERYLQNFDNPNQDLKEADNMESLQNSLRKEIERILYGYVDDINNAQGIDVDDLEKVAGDIVDYIMTGLNDIAGSLKESLYENNGMNVVANILEMIKNGSGDEEIIAYMMDNNFESEEQAREQLLLLKGALDKMKQAINPAPSRIQSQLAAMRDKYRR
jgi:hypothetical protein